jgi:hypothetical protein
VGVRDIARLLGEARDRERQAAEWQRIADPVQDQGWAQVQTQRDRVERRIRERTQRAQELGVTQERVVIVLAEHVQTGGGGRLHVPSVSMAVAVAGGGTVADDARRLEKFAREAVLPLTCPNTSKRRQVPEALGEAGGLCTAQTVKLSTGDIVLCTHEAGHYDPADKDRNPGCWQLSNASIDGCRVLTPARRQSIRAHSGTIAPPHLRFSIWVSVMVRVGGAVGALVAGSLAELSVAWQFGCREVRSRCLTELDRRVFAAQE